jgi:hypothetical protein
VRAWVRSLESDDAAERVDAAERLKRSPWTIEPYLTGEGLFLEARELQAKIRAWRNPEPPRLEGEPLRRRRAIQILERIGGPEVKAALTELAAASPHAAEALRRLR